MLGGLEPLVGLSPADRWFGYLCFSVQGFGVARFLPTDGNTFRESRSGERDDWFATTSVGLMIGYGRFLVSYTYNDISGLTNPGGVRANSQNDYATIVFSYLF